MVSNPSAYRVVGHFAVADVGHFAFCEHCKNPVYDRAVYGHEPEMRQRVRRGWVVLKDTMYRVRGPGGDRQVCRPCVERCGFRRNDEHEESLAEADDW